MMIYALLEKVYLLYEKKWIDESTRREWETWLAFIAKHPMFFEVHLGSKGMFNRSFQDHVSRLVELSLTGTAESTRETPGP